MRRAGPDGVADRDLKRFGPGPGFAAAAGHDGMARAVIALKDPLAHEV